MSDNSYKGVKGGDPSRRSAHINSLVSISYVCPSCKQEKSEIFPEGKDLTGRICGKCRDIENTKKDKERQEKARHAAFTRPIRTTEEQESLLAAYAHVPRHDCAKCGGNFIEFEPSMSFWNDDYNRPNSIQTVSYRTNPYDYEIYEVRNPKWFCNRCYDELEADI